jgi:hypothetical protein
MPAKRLVNSAEEVRAVAIWLMLVVPSRSASIQ